MDWIKEKEDVWINHYIRSSSHQTAIQQFAFHDATYFYDLTESTGSSVHDRLVAAHCFSKTVEKKRDKSRARSSHKGAMVNPMNGVLYDKGHALAHSIGGGLDVNLFPQLAEINRGRSEKGKLFRAMEQFSSSNPGTFTYIRLFYNDETWFPNSFEYGVMKENGEIWNEVFLNY